MSENRDRPPRSFWIIGSIALLWNVIGLAAYVIQVTMPEEAMNALPEAQRLAIEARPAWATSAFAIATTAGVLGCMLLLLRSSWAVPLFLASLAAVFVQVYYDYVMANAIGLFGIAGVVQTALIIGIGVALIWYSRVAKENGWFR